MRATCARVLAAALMTGAIATVVAMSALFGTPGPARRPLAAPPSSLQRSVPLVAQPAPRHRTVVRQPEPVHRVSTPSRPVIVTRNLVIVRTHHTRPPHRRELASVKPKPPPKPVAAPAPAATGPAAAAPAPVAAAPTEAVDHDDHGDHGDHGDHDHGQGHGHEEHDG